MLNNFNSIPFKTATCLSKNKQQKYKKSCIKTKIQIRNKTKETKIKIKTLFFCTNFVPSQLNCCKFSRIYNDVLINTLSAIAIVVGSTFEQFRSE